MANPEWDNYNPYPKMMGDLIYLAVPYTHLDSKVVEDRVRRVATVAYKLLAQRKYVYSPITHCHPLAKIGKLPTDWSFWKEYDTVMISRCTALYVLMLDGWRESTGVQAEIKLAKQFDIPVVYIDEELKIESIVCDYTQETDDGL